ncbi:pentapeptide repeat-containing protein [Tessaracoccus sp. OS52]|uniref:pentapeptide repeat-containing protein n=1 Tax=Tessaracoccus sp. OS52 TaxID=2886691 RepID=UPI001D109759|nr:pentapeptide repeat-containing protein [Tessaracoccus sp. OS52]MCC2594202.1 pentapeptide repeat-containing protein [Tessaracoccus sp. OS52]
MRGSDGPKPPQLRAVDFGTLTEGQARSLEPNADLFAHRWAGLRTTKLDLGKGSVVNGCEFDDVVVDELTLASSRFVDTRFHLLAVPVLRMARSALRDVEFDGCRLGAVEAFDLDAKAVHFRNCRISYLNLRGSKLLDVAFTDCIVDELDLLQADAKRIAFAGSRVGSLAVHNSKVADFDLRGAELSAVSGWVSLAGATLSEDQLMFLAPQIAAELGIRVG